MLSGEIALKNNHYYYLLIIILPAYMHTNILHISVCVYLQKGTKRNVKKLYLIFPIDLDNTNMKA